MKTGRTAEEINHLIDTDEDFINYPRFDNSVKKMQAKYPNGVKNEIIAKALNCTPEEVETHFQTAVKKLKTIMKVGANGKRD